eukprot:TRINITY_DN2096_c0_g1_i1.p1 TRINITY_DN2096_c0_g1~~TRINITY_DN2096_c0_g1_i1.p1  ORF type:complete len:130 (-),score=29.78 TRINITY_DN2096_c0_g1_i1:28-417(-)
MANSNSAVADFDESEPPARDDPRRGRFPYSIVWTPLPLISWLLPFIGHVGIATSSGVVHDFAGPYFVSQDDLAFGRATKRARLDPARAAPSLTGEPEHRAWDRAVYKCAQDYSKRMVGVKRHRKMILFS